MTRLDSEELVGRLKRIVELSEKLLAIPTWNDETRNLRHLISHELALAQHELLLYKPNQK